MSARKATTTSAIENLTVEARQTRLTLSPDAVIISRGGIEFRSATQFSPWADMTVTLQSPSDGATVRCSGVVIACTGSRHTGYHVSMVFTGLSKQAEARLNTMALR